MTSPLEEGRDRALSNLEHIVCELEWLRQDVKEKALPSKLLQRIKEIEEYLLEAREEDECRRARVAELEEGLRPIVETVKSVEGAGFPDYKPVNATHFEPRYNDFVSLNWGHLRRAASLLEGVGEEGESGK